MTEISRDTSVARTRADRHEPEACTDPQAEASRLEKERAAAERRDAWIAGSGAETRKSRATGRGSEGPVTCELSPESERELRRFNESQETAKHDLPLEDDPLGNALPGLLVGGLPAAARGAAEAGARAALKEAAEDAATHFAGEAAVHAAEAAHGAHAGAAEHAEAASGARADARPAPASAPAPGPTPTPSPAPSAPAAPAGRSGTSAVCEPADPPGGRSEPTPPAGQDRVPYKPGAAPLRVPEAPREAVERPFVAAG